MVVRDSGPPALGPRRSTATGWLSRLLPATAPPPASQACPVPGATLHPPPAGHGASCPPSAPACPPSLLSHHFPSLYGIMPPPSPPTGPPSEEVGWLFATLLAAHAACLDNADDWRGPFLRRAGGALRLRPAAVDALVAQAAVADSALGEAAAESLLAATTRPNGCHGRGGNGSCSGSGNDDGNVNSNGTGNDNGNGSGDGDGDADAVAPLPVLDVAALLYTVLTAELPTAIYDARVRARSEEHRLNSSHT